MHGFQLRTEADKGNVLRANLFYDIIQQSDKHSSCHSNWPYSWISNEDCTEIVAWRADCTSVFYADWRWLCGCWCVDVGIIHICMYTSVCVCVNIVLVKRIAATIAAAERWMAGKLYIQKMLDPVQADQTQKHWNILCCIYVHFISFAHVLYLYIRAFKIFHYIFRSFFFFFLIWLVRLAKLKVNPVHSSLINVSRYHRNIRATNKKIYRRIFVKIFFEMSYFEWTQKTV